MKTFFHPTDYYEIKFTSDADAKQQKKENFLQNQLPHFLKTSERLLKKAGGDFVTGGEVNSKFGQKYEMEAERKQILFLS